MTQSKLVTAIMAVPGLAALYMSLIRMYETKNAHIDEQVRLKLHLMVRAIATCAICTSAFLTILMPVLNPDTTLSVGKVLLLGTVKAVHWISMLQLV